MTLALDEMRGLREACRYDPEPDPDDPAAEEKGSVDSLIAYKDALEDRLLGLLNDLAAARDAGPDLSSLSGAHMRVLGYALADLARRVDREGDWPGYLGEFGGDVDPTTAGACRVAFVQLTEAYHRERERR